MSTPRLLPRLLLAAGLAAALSGCGNDPTKPDPVAQIRQAVSGLGAQTPGPSAAQIRANLTPELRAQFGAAPLKIGTLESQSLASLLIGIGDNRGVVTFSTPDGVSFAFDQGVLVATRGLGFDLLSADTAEIRTALAAGGGTARVRIHRYLDGENQIVIRSFVCDVSAQGRGVLRERCFGDGLQFDNTYQRGRGGEITASRQWIGPERGHVVIEDAG